MSQLVSYKDFRLNQYIPELGLFYNVWRFYLETVCLASLILFSIAATDRGESFMSKALATSGFFKGATKK